MSSGGGIFWARTRMIIMGGIKDGREDTDEDDCEIEVERRWRQCGIEP